MRTLGKLLFGLKRYQRRGTEMKNWLAGVAVFVAVLAAMLLAGEWVVRILYADQTVLFPRYHTDVQYGDYTLRRIRPNSSFRHTSVDGSWEFVTNSQGFRSDEDYSYDKPQGVLRILSLGDSHTQGYEVRQDHTFSAVLERYLEKHGVPAQVINTGVSGFSTAEELVFLENEGLRYQPDVVVLGFFANDLEDNIKAALFKLDESGVLVENSDTHIPGVRVQNVIYVIPGIKWLSENSYFYSLLFNTAWEFFKARMARQSAASVTEFAVPQKNVYSNYETEIASALLARLYSVCERNGIKLVVVDIPVQVADGQVVSSFPETLRSAALRYSHAFIESGVVFEEYAGTVDLHVLHGHRHISEFSHTIIGVEIGRRILQFKRDDSLKNGTTKAN